MDLNLTILTSTSIKRKKPWPKVEWLGKNKGGLYLLDKSRVSQLYLPSGKTRRKIPSVHPFLVDVQALCTSSNGHYLAGALKSGKVFVWERDSDSLHTTPILEKIRNVLGSNNKKVKLFISNCGKKIVFLSGYDQLFLWETESDSVPLAPGEPFEGRWVQIQNGDYRLPTEQDKETAIDGIFFEDQIHGLCCLVSWVFNKQDRMLITTLRLQWPLPGNTVGFDYDADSLLPFSAKWFTFVHSLYGLTPAKRVVKSTKAYVARFSFDGQIMAVAMNQKVAMDTRMMFYSTTSSSVAIVTDLKGCGSQNVQNVASTGKLWWVSDMAWTTNNLFLMIITRCGSLAVLTKLGEPVLVTTTENAVDMGPAFYLPLHPRITFKKPNVNGDSDSSMSLHSDTDVLQQRYSITVHPTLPIILTTDGYLVTIMQLPGNASYKGAMASFMSSVSSLVPEVQHDPDMVPLSTSISRVNIFQSENNLSRVQSVEELSENTQSSCSSSLAGFGLASGDQGMAFMPIIPSDFERLPPEHQDISWKFVEAQNNSLKSLAVGVSAGPYWSKEISSALCFVIKGVVKLFSIYLRDHEHLDGSLTNSLKMLSKFKTSKLQSEKLEDCFGYFKMALELFLWDAHYRNAFTLALRLINGFIKEILGCKSLDDVSKIASSITFLEFAEEVLGSVYSWKQSSKASSNGDVIDRFSPNKSIPRGSYKLPDAQGDQESLQDVSEIVEESSQSNQSTLQESPRESSQVTKALSASWLMLYNYTAQSSRRQSKLQETGDSGQVTELLCDIQKKLQDIGVSIPTGAALKPEHMSAVASFIERDDAVTVAGLIDSPGDSLFGRRRANRIDQEPSQSTPIRLRKAGSLDRLLDVSAINKTSSKPNQSTTTNQSDTTTETLLAILYLNLQQYNLRAALDLVFSLLEPALDHLDTTFSALFTLDSLRATRGQDNSSNQLLSILVQTFPIVRIADMVGLPVVQSLGRFMAAYFSNLGLYVFPAYHPDVLPPYNIGERSRHESTSDESFALSQGVEVVHLDREKVALAVRDQGISDVWCANNAVELMLISGLIGEASWLSNNLGDWKHSLLLATSHTLHPCHHKTTAQLCTIPHHITPENIILTQLQPVLSTSPLSLPNIPKYLLDVPEDATSTPNRDRLIVEKPTDGKTQLTMDEKVATDVSKILQAAVVAGIDVVPGLCWTMLQELLVLVSQVDWIVPEEIYLPAPPLYCPQPPHAETEFLLPRVYREKQLRSDIAGTVQKLLTLLHSSNCMAACMQWYVNQLVSTNEKWYNTTKDDQDFIVPQSLVAHNDIVTSFSAADLSLVRALKRNSSKPKDIPSPPRPSKTAGSSVSSVLACFHQFCCVMWLLHARDAMSLCARKYRQARNQAATDQEIADEVEGLCWETLQWTLQLQPFGSFLGASTELSDSLLTLLSEMQPSISTAQITAQYFPDLNLIPTTSGRAKFKRLMTQFRGITLREAGSIEEDNHDEPLSVFYREKCLEWEDEIKEREGLFHRVQEEVFPRENDDSDLPHGNTKPAFTTNKDIPCVGSLVFETSRSYLDFLDTFFIITFTKNAAEMTGQATTAIPLLLPYEKLFTFNETKSLKELQVKAAAEKEKKPPQDNSLSRSQSCTDVRSNKPRQTPIRGPGQTDIRRASSMSDISKTSSNSGVAVLGSDLLDMLPRLAWLSRWSSEGLPTTSVHRRTIQGHPVMKVDVELALLVNTLWLIDNVYTPWELNEQVNPEFLKAVPKPVIDHHPIELGVQSESSLRRASSDSNIPKVTVQSPTTEEESVMNKKEMRESKKKRLKQQEQEPAVTFKSHSDTEFNLPRPMRNRDATQPKINRKNKTARRTLNLDLPDEAPAIEENIIETVDVKTRRKKKTAKPRSPSKTSSSNHSNTVTDQLTAQEVIPVMVVADMAVQDRGSGREEVQPPQGTQVVSGERIIGHGSSHTQPIKPQGTQVVSGERVIGHGSSQTQPINAGMELVLLLRSDPNSQPNSTGADVPLLKLSTITSNENHPTERTAKNRKKKSKEIASQTDSPVNANFSRQTRDGVFSERSLTSNALPAAVDFTAQYDESRNVSCQTVPLSPRHLSYDNETTSSQHLKYNGTPNRANYPMPDHPSQFNGMPSRGNGEMRDRPTQYDGIPSRTNQMQDNGGQFNGVPSSHQHQLDGRPSNDSVQYNDTPSNQASQYSGVLSNQPYQYNGLPYRQHQGDGGQQSTRTAWPEQNVQNTAVPFPLLHFPGRTQGNQHTNSKQAIPPFTGFQSFRGYPPFTGYPPSNQPTINDHSFPLLQIPKQATSQPTKTFRLFEVPPASRDLPFLQMPKSHDKQTRPDLSKIKFADVKTTRDPCVMLQMDNVKSRRGQPLLHVLAQDTKVPQARNIPVNQSPMVLLHIPKEKTKPKLVPVEELEAFERRTRRGSDEEVVDEKENVKPKKIRERKRKRQAERRDEPQRQDVRNTPSRQRRRQHISSSPHPTRTDNETNHPKIVQVKPASQTKEKKTTKPKERKQPVQLDKGLSEESDIELSEISHLSDEEQLYFHVQAKPTVSNREVDEYCRELEERVKKQFEKELEELKQHQMELEVKERVRKEMEKQREQDEVRRRLEEERLLQERLEREKEELEEKLKEKDSPRPVPRKRSVKWEQGSFVCHDDEVLKTSSTKTQNIQTQSDLVRRSVDQVTQTTEPRTSAHTQPKSLLTEEVSGPHSFAPVLPPDIFLGLTFTRDGGQNLDNEPQVEGNKESGVGKESTRQFVSVADIDSELWNKIRSGNKMTDKQKHHGHQVREVEESEDEDVPQEVEQVPSKESSVVSHDLNEDEEERSKQFDPLTVKMMESFESPKAQRLTRPPMTSSGDAQSISKQRLSTRLEEMNERFEAIEKITQNMDRQFHSSNVLLNAIDSIGDIMSPSTEKPAPTHSKKPNKLSRGQRISSRGKRETAPWRRDGPAIASNLETPQSQLNDTEELNTRETKVSFQDTNEPEDRHYDSIDEELSLEGERTLGNDDEGRDSEKDEYRDSESSRDATPTEKIQTRDQTKTRDRNESRDTSESNSPPESHDHVKTGTAQKQRERLIDEEKSDKDPLKDVAMMSSDKLKEIFSDSYDSSKRTSQRSAEKRKKVQNWMAKKRKERHTEWKNQIDELRSTEYKPFTTTNEGPSTLKKIKLAEKERETKRRTRQETQIDSRIKEASNLINEMLAEPVPKSNTLQNLHHAPSSPKSKHNNNLHYAPPPPKSKHNNRYNTKASTKKPSKRTGPASTLHRDPIETPLTSSPLYPNMDNGYDAEINTNRYGVETPNSQFAVGARSVTPSGSDFVTTKTYRMHEKDKLRRSQELEKELGHRQQPNMDINGLYNTAGSIDIDGLMDQIPDGSTIDEDGLDDLISDDSELKELLSDVLGTRKGARGKGVVKKSGSALMGTVTLSKDSRKPAKQIAKTTSKTTRNTPKGPQQKQQPTSRISQNKSSMRKPLDNRPTTTNRLLNSSNNKATKSRGVSATGGKAGKTSKDPERRLDGFDNNKSAKSRGISATGGKASKTSKYPERRLDGFDDVSPWNTGDGLKMSDDVAQLLAEAKEVIGDDISESSGSIMSNIDWDAVDKIMNDM